MMAVRQKHWVSIEELDTLKAILIYEEEKRAGIKMSEFLRYK